MVVKIKRKDVIEFMAVGLGKGGRDFYHFKDEDKYNIELVPEPDNKYDKHAIKIYVKNKFVCYVSSDTNKMVNLFLKRDHNLSFYLIDKYSKSARWLLIDLDLSLKRLL